MSTSGSVPTLPGRNTKDLTDWQEMRRKNVCVLGLWAIFASMFLVVVFHGGPWTTVVRRSVPADADYSGSLPRGHSALRSASRNITSPTANNEHNSSNSVRVLSDRGSLGYPVNVSHQMIECNKDTVKECCEKQGAAVETNDHQLKAERVTRKLTRHTGGYMLSFRYYEQQTQGTRNLLQMQCLAHSFGMKVVEPFVYKSTFAIPISEVSSTVDLSKKYLSLGDLVDMNQWNTEAHSKFGYTSITSWEDFLLHAPRNIIAHCIRYRNPPKIHVPIPGYNYREGCSDLCFDKFIKSMEYLSAFGFQLVEKTCSNFVDYAGSVTTGSFYENIKGKYLSDEVTVMVNEFRGFFGLYRLPVLSECGILHKSTNVSTLPSPRIRNDALKYSNDVFQGRPYAAVIARIERVILHLHHNVSNCSQEIVSLLKSLEKSHGISDTFLAMDVGKFGSSGSTRNHFQPYGKVLFNSIYGDKWSFKKWEDSFESSASSNNPAYIANLQRTIAASSGCLILFGGGGFQGQAQKLYEIFHPDPKAWCIYKVCSR